MLGLLLSLQNIKLQYVHYVSEIHFYMHNQASISESKTIGLSLSFTPLSSSKHILSMLFNAGLPSCRSTTSQMVFFFTAYQAVVVCTLSVYTLHLTHVLCIACFGLLFPLPKVWAFQSATAIASLAVAYSTSSSSHSAALFLYCNCICSWVCTGAPAVLLVSNCMVNRSTNILWVGGVTNWFSKQYSLRVNLTHTRWWCKIPEPPFMCRYSIFHC